MLLFNLSMHPGTAYHIHLQIDSPSVFIRHVSLASETQAHRRTFFRNLFTFAMSNDFAEMIHSSARLQPPPGPLTVTLSSLFFGTRLNKYFFCDATIFGMIEMAAADNMFYRNPSQVNILRRHVLIKGDARQRWQSKPRPIPQNTARGFDSAGGGWRVTGGVCHRLPFFRAR